MPSHPIPSHQGGEHFKVDTGRWGGVLRSGLFAGAQLSGALLRRHCCLETEHMVASSSVLSCVLELIAVGLFLRWYECPPGLGAGCPLNHTEYIKGGVLPLVAPLRTR